MKPEYGRIISGGLKSLLQLFDSSSSQYSSNVVDMFKWFAPLKDIPRPGAFTDGFGRQASFVF